MRKTLIAFTAAATLIAAAVATPGTADARRGWWGPAVIGGFAAGAIIGGALAARPHYYPYYGPGPVAPGPVQYEYYQEPPYEVVPEDCWGWRKGVRYRAC
jgi:hypothetical protein